MDNIVLLSITADDLRHIVSSAVSEALAERPAASAPTPQKQPDEYLSRVEVCSMLRLTNATLRNLEIRGELMPVRIARRVLYRQRDVEGALKGREAGGGSAGYGRSRRRDVQ